jgi:hypothetical protein
MGKSKKCNCECRCKSSNVPLRTNAVRVFGRIDNLDDVKILPVFVNASSRFVNARTSFTGYLSDSGLVEKAQSNPGASWLNPIANDKYGVL